MYWQEHVWEWILRVLNQWSNIYLDREIYIDMGQLFHNSAFTFLARTPKASPNMLLRRLLEAWKPQWPLVIEVEMLKISWQSIKESSRR